MKKLSLLFTMVLCAALAAGCGDDDGGDDDDDDDTDAGEQPDAGDGPDGGDEPDAPPAGEGCAKLDTPAGTIEKYPGEFSGDIADDQPAIDVAAGICAVENAPFGVVAPGPDEVVLLTGLTPGTTYRVELNSPDDLAVYVLTGCTGDGAPVVGECLVFTDVNGGAVAEIDGFVAPDSGEAFLVIDHFLEESPADGTYTVSVAAAECAVDGDCENADAPFCISFGCEQCRNDFHCTDGESPICDAATFACGPGFDACTGDDAGESADDGPAGAGDITPVVGNTNEVTGSICSDPATEVDYWQFTVALNGEGYSVTLDWEDDTVDLDIEILDAEGTLVGLGYYERPEPVAVTFLPAGTYYVTVRQFSAEPVTAATPYTLSVQRTLGTICTSVADCAAEFRNQAFRGACTAGACTFLPDDASLAPGELCDTNGDCDATSTLCTAFSFTADADTRGFCSPECAEDAECVTALGDGYVCMSFYCSLPCTADDECPVRFDQTPEAGEPWVHYACVDGKCNFEP
jgi:hypothetical protein